MNKNKTITEIICFLLMLNFFFEGINKIAYFEMYSWWATHKPLIKQIGGILSFFVPALEIAIAIFLLIPKYRKIALYAVIAAEIIFILWVMSVYLFTSILFWPYHAIWKDPTWMQKMLYGLLLSWLAFIAIIVNARTVNTQNHSIKKLLRNKPAHVS